MNKHYTNRRLVSENCELAEQIWGDALDPLRLRSLAEITRSFGFSIAMRDVLLLHSGWYVTHAGLIRLAKRRNCAGIKVEAVTRFCDPAVGRWSFRATVYRSRTSKGFTGHGDADPSNVSSLVRGAEMRVAETRAVNRALRKAYGIGLCSVEELGSYSSLPQGPRTTAAPPSHSNGNGSGRSEPRLRDRLCLLIRQHNLDPTLVKAYAADFCGTASLKEASRERIESFISHLAKAATEDRDALVCKLNSYSQLSEVKS